MELGKKVAILEWDWGRNWAPKSPGTSLSGVQEIIITGPDISSLPTG